MPVGSIGSAPRHDDLVADIDRLIEQLSDVTGCHRFLDADSTSLDLLQAFHRLGGLLTHVTRRDLEHVCGLGEFGLLDADVLVGVEAGDRLDTTQVGADATLTERS